MHARETDLCAEVFDAEIAIGEVLLEDGLEACEERSLADGLQLVLFRGLWGLGVCRCVFGRKVTSAPFSFRRDSLLTADGLLCPQVFQHLSATKQVLYAGEQQLRFERLGDVGIGTATIAFYLVCREGAGGEQDHWNMARCKVILHLLAELQTIHHGHHYIADNQVGHIAQGDFQSLLAIGSFADGVERCKDGAQIGTDVGIVVDDEDGQFFGGFLLGVCGSRLLLLGDVGHFLGFRVRRSFSAQNLVDQFGQLVGITTDDVEHGMCRGVVVAHGLGLLKLLQRTGDERQRRAQLVGGLGVEVYLLACHLLAFLVDADSCATVVPDEEGGKGEQKDDAQ